jgi:hypothetical protein
MGDSAAAAAAVAGTAAGWRDGRQSQTALAVQRGTCRLLRMMGFAAVTELALSTGHRADIVGLGPKGELWIVEIKSSPQDLAADHKWPAYFEHCDRLHFAVPADLPRELLPAEAGIIVADRFGAAILREAPERRLAAARRRAVQMRFARAAALRLHDLIDPDGALAAG